MKGSRAVALVGAATVWGTLAAGIAALGWMIGMRSGPVPGGCQCFNPLGLPFVLGWGPLGGLLAVLAFCVISVGVGLALHVRSRRRTRGLGVETDPESDVDLDGWLGERVEEQAPRG